LLYARLALHLGERAVTAVRRSLGTLDVGSSPSESAVAPDTQDFPQAYVEQIWVAISGPINPSFSSPVVRPHAGQSVPPTRIELVHAV